MCARNPCTRALPTSRMISVGCPSITQNSLRETRPLLSPQICFRSDGPHPAGSPHGVDTRATHATTFRLIAPDAAEAVRTRSPWSGACFGALLGRILFGLASQELRGHEPSRTDVFAPYATFSEAFGLGQPLSTAVLRPPGRTSDKCTTTIGRPTVSASGRRKLGPEPRAGRGGPRDPTPCCFRGSRSVAFSKACEKTSPGSTAKCSRAGSGMRASRRCYERC